WNQISSMNQSQRIGSIGFVANNCLYVGLGDVPGGVDSAFWKLCLSSDVKELSPLNFIIYPNPSLEKINVTVSENISGGILNIYNLTGKLLFTEKFSTALHNEINISLLPAGIYFIKYKSGVKEMIEKLIVLKP